MIANANAHEEFNAEIIMSTFGSRIVLLFRQPFQLLFVFNNHALLLSWRYNF